MTTTDMPSLACGFCIVRVFHHAGHCKSQKSKQVRHSHGAPLTHVGEGLLAPGHATAP